MVPAAENRKWFVLPDNPCKNADQHESGGFSLPSKGAAEGLRVLVRRGTAHDQHLTMVLLIVHACFCV